MVYLSWGKVKHLLALGQSPNDRDLPALCGVTPGLGFWYGTGSWEESERARNLPLCQNCSRWFIRTARRRRRPIQEVQLPE